MCGIAGFVSMSSGAVKGLEAMNDALKHRGPDSTGTKIWADQGVGFSHRRLSIIDLSPAGDNPMSNEDGSVWITFNGEIYNFRELRKELERLGHQFRSMSDTEVVIHAYEQWGDDHMLRLRGMFAYAIYDRRVPSRRLLLVRDRLGIKPLYYYEADGSFVFASELKALLVWPNTDVTLDRSAVFDFSPTDTSQLRRRHTPRSESSNLGMCWAMSMGRRRPDSIGTSSLAWRAPLLAKKMPLWSCGRRSRKLFATTWSVMCPLASS